MADLKCPHCGRFFTVDDTELGSIIQQIRDSEFNKDVHERLEELTRSMDEKMELQLRNKENEVRLEAKTAHEEELQELKDALLKEREASQGLRQKLEASDTERKLAVMEAMKQAEDEKRGLEHELSAQKDRYEILLDEKEKEVSLYKDLKTRMSTKMVGETLEQHCETEFNKLRATAFKDAYFEKDNDVRTGSKGDYIYREMDESGAELISIMFEMKNETDTTSTKHKNEDFFKELDKDRREKNCEYAVLVSLLEADSELYNAGIVDVSYRYEKMYVVRPQCFIPIITLLRNASLSAMEYKRELAAVRNQNVDITNFENNLMKFKQDFGRNYEIAHSHFDKAIDEIDKTISHLEKVKKELMGSDNQLRIANGKVEDVSIKRLTKDNPTMQAMFEGNK
ncbi:MAG: DUF2130 domain-containing protein [Lachnospiraceae bacterium]|nr:DUF2130 domain-containing protein [Lachnospiraceae bacterium]